MGRVTADLEIRGTATWWVVIVACIGAQLLSGPVRADELDDFMKLTDINDGELEFLTEQPQAPYPRQVSHSTVTVESLRTGWVRNHQCFHNLDSADAMQVVYRPGRVRNLEVVSFERIGKAWVEENSVQLEDVLRDSILCVKSENAALYIDNDDSFYFGAGPFMRRFLDGYFPMEVNMTLDYPDKEVAFDYVKPPATEGGRVVLTPGRLTYHALFEGRLQVLVRFVKREDAN
jgi:hypothetical protein